MGIDLPCRSGWGRACRRAECPRSTSRGTLQRGRLSDKNGLSARPARRGRRGNTGRGGCARDGTSGEQVTARSDACREALSARAVHEEIVHGKDAHEQPEAEPHRDGQEHAHHAAVLILFSSRSVYCAPQGKPKKERPSPSFIRSKRRRTRPRA